MTRLFSFVFIIFSCCLIDKVFPGAQKITAGNVDTLLASNELVFVNFYANWCRFSQMLEPIYDELADKVAKEFPESGKLAVGKVDCDVETSVAQKNQINKYPTLKLFRYGVALKKEYRGARSVEGFFNYLKEQLASAIKIAHSPGDINTQESRKGTVIAYFESDQSESYKTFAKMANILRDSCEFVAAIGPAFAHKRPSGDLVTFRTRGGNEPSDISFAGNINEYDVLYSWTNDRCTPIVREITFENAEELTEEGLPFLILFHRPDDLDSVKVFEREVIRQLSHQRNTINAVHADGNKFSHPLHHLGKSVNDLPVIAIDSFRHMYLFPDYNRITDGSSLSRFVEDLHSGKLHREFHNGPDPTQEPPKQIDGSQHIPDLIPNKEIDGSQHIPKPIDNNNPRKSTPPESVFVKLGPSGNRYSIKHGDGGEL